MEKGWRRQRLDRCPCYPSARPGSRPHAVCRCCDRRRSRYSHRRCRQLSRQAAARVPPCGKGSSPRNRAAGSVLNCSPGHFCSSLDAGMAPAKIIANDRPTPANTFSLNIILIAPYSYQKPPRPYTPPLLIIPIALESANAGHGGGFGGGGIGGIHVGGGGIGHFSGGNIGHFDGGHIGAMGRAHFADAGGIGGGRWHGGSVRHANNWKGNWHGHDHNHFVHDHRLLRQPVRPYRARLVACLLCLQ